MYKLENVNVVLTNNYKIGMNGTKLYQIKAVNEIRNNGYIIEKGELGGYVSAGIVFNHNAWVTEDSEVYNIAKEGNVILDWNVIVENSTVIYDDRYTTYYRLGKSIDGASYKDVVALGYRTVYHKLDLKYNFKDTFNCSFEKEKDSISFRDFANIVMTKSGKNKMIFGAFDYGREYENRYYSKIYILRDNNGNISFEVDDAKPSYYNKNQKNLFFTKYLCLYDERLKFYTLTNHIDNFQKIDRELFGITEYRKIGTENVKGIKILLNHILTTKLLNSYMVDMKCIPTEDDYGWSNPYRYDVINLLDDKKSQSYKNLEQNFYLNLFAKENNIQGDELINLLKNPCIETLVKAGYKIGNTLLKEGDKNVNFPLDSTGKNPNEIFGVGEVYGFSKLLIKALKNCDNITIWNGLFDLESKGVIDEKDIKMLNDEVFLENFGKFDNRDFETMSVILERSREVNFNGKIENHRIFSLEKLIKYLYRLDLNEALETSNALHYIDDYMRMCEQFGIEPDFTKDSLVREHNIVQRNLRHKMDAEKNELIANEYEKNKWLDGKMDDFTFEVIKDHNDLLREAKEQSNCVASYTDRIIKGVSIIISMKLEGKSHITVELNKDLEIRQAYRKCNQRLEAVEKTILKKYVAMKIAEKTKNAKNQFIA